MKASALSFPAATLLAIAGMIWGIVMAASGDHSAMPAHAEMQTRPMRSVGSPVQGE